jgi:hypothetical protein
MSNTAYIVCQDCIEVNPAVCNLQAPTGRGIGDNLREVVIEESLRLRQEELHYYE